MGKKDKKDKANVVDSIPENLKIQYREDKIPVIVINGVYYPS